MQFHKAQCSQLVEWATCLLCREQQQHGSWGRLERHEETCAQLATLATFAGALVKNIRDLGIENCDLLCLQGQPNLFPSVSKQQKSMYGLMQDLHQKTLSCAVIATGRADDWVIFANASLTLSMLLERMERSAFQEQGNAQWCDQVEEETGLQRQKLNLISVWPAIMDDRQKHNFIFKGELSVAEAAPRSLAARGKNRELDPLRWFNFYKRGFRAIEGGNIYMKTRTILQDLQQQLFPVPV